MTDPTYRETGGGAVETDDRKGTVVAYLSKGTPDLYGETLSVSGWDLSIMKSVGAISFNHLGTPMGEWSNASIYQKMPIARLLRIWTDSEGVLAHYAYPVEAEGQYGEFVRTLYFLEKEGLLRGHSHWFTPYAWTDPDGSTGERSWGDPNPQIPFKGRVYTRQAMLEGGPVVAPAHPDAVTVAAKAFSSKSLPVPPGFVAIEEEEPAPKIVESTGEFIAWEAFRAKVLPQHDENKEREGEAALLREFGLQARHGLDALTTHKGG